MLWVTRRRSVAASAGAVALAARAGAAWPVRDAAAQAPTAPSAVVIGQAGPLAAAVAARLGRAGFAARVMEPAAPTEAAWQAAFAVTAAPPARAIVNLCIVDRSGPVGGLDAQAFRAALDDGYVRTFLAMKYGILALRAGGGGAFLNVTSADGRSGAADAAARCAAANGVMQMTKCVALECAAKKDGVRVNAILAGTLAPIGPVALDDIAEAAAFLSGPAAIYLTGLLMPVHGGGRA
ncbi:MAG: SDR family oxidoreductase [Rhodospirillaceae bacterium]|nr:SDR family oxidoreductase [Rhodospirillaceae bacterium]